MKLYLVRHGAYVADDLQMRNGLSSEGTAAVNHLVSLLQPLNLSVSHIFHSGKLRAEQTAELLTNAFSSEHPMQVKPGLNPEDDVIAFANEMTHWESDVLAVGHLPFMGRLVGQLIVGDPNKDIVDFQTATMVCLEQVMLERWIIKWVLSQDLF